MHTKKFQLRLDAERLRWMRAEARRLTEQAARKVTMAEILRAGIDALRHQATIAARMEAPASVSGKEVGRG